MKYSTRDFGEMEIDDSKVFTFAQPPFGFEKYKKYTLIYDKEIGKEIVWLQSLEEPALCFMMMDPSGLRPYFEPKLSDQAEKLLGVGEYECWAMMSIPGQIKDATINLKSPIFLNMEENRGAQIMLDQDYPVRFGLAADKEG